MRLGNGQFIFCYSAEYLSFIMWTQTGHLTVAIAIIATIAIPSFHIKYSTSDKTCQQVGRPILSNICTLEGGESIFVQISDIYVNWS